MGKDETQPSFDPNAAPSMDAGIFGLPFKAEQADIIIIPVEWETTISSGSGTARAPAAILEASHQIDLHHHDYPDTWKKGCYLDAFPADMADAARNARKDAKSIIAYIHKGHCIEAGSRQERVLTSINRSCEHLNEWIRQRCAYWKNKGKQVCLLGGDHSTTLGYLQLHAENCNAFGILHIDAHHDLRKAYEGFTYSHASVFYNALSGLPAISKLVQVGVRDYCEQEADYVRSQKGRIDVFYERDLRKRLYQGEGWYDLCKEIISCLPRNVHVSIDIDGLDPALCPHTGTPVPGGLAYEELMFLLNTLQESGRRLIGCDLCEVAPGPDGWDANVGARILFHLCALAGTMSNRHVSSGQGL